MEGRTSEPGCWILYPATRVGDPEKKNLGGQTGSASKWRVDLPLWWSTDVGWKKYNADGVALAGGNRWNNRPSALRPRPFFASPVPQIAARASKPERVQMR